MTSIRRVSLSLTLLVCMVVTACDKPEKPPVTPSGNETAQSAASTYESNMEQASESADSSEAPPPRKSQREGLWQLTQTLPQLGGSSVAKICVSEDQGERLAVIGQDLLGKPEMDDLSCMTRSVVRLASGADIDTVCEVNATTLTSHIHVDIIGNEAFHQTAETRYSPAFAGHGRQITVTDGKRLGDCPAGMKAGDYLNGDGVKMKVGKVLAKFS